MSNVRTSLNNFQAKQSMFRDEVKKQNLILHNALNVEIERTENTKLIPNWEVIAASMPFVMSNASHIGYAETEKINDSWECFSQVVDSGAYVIADVDGWVYPDLLWNNKFEVAQAKERFAQNNGTYVGRILARFNHLVNKRMEVPETPGFE